MDLQGRNLSIEMRGEDVKQLHAELRQLKFEIPEAESRRSIFGEVTREVVSKVQESNGLKPTGEVDEETARLLTTLLQRSESEEAPEPARSRPPSRLEELLNTIPGGFSRERKVLVQRVLEDKTDPAILLAEKLRKAGLDEKEVKAVERTEAFRTFSGDFLPLIKTLQNEEIGSLRDLALTTNRTTLTKKIIENKAHPEGESPEDFAGRLYGKLFQAEPTAVLRNMLDDPEATPVEDETIRKNLSGFLSRLPETFNITTTSVYDAFRNEKAFADATPELREKIKTELKSLQRVTALSPVPEVVPVLMKANLTSALMVSDMPEKQFVQAFAKQLGANGEAVARQVHENATTARIRNEQALIALKEIKQGTGIAAIDKTLHHPRRGGDEFNGALENNNLSWDSLFGDSNLCECGECTSVYSAANYFVELLQYLRNNNLDPDASGPQGINSDPKDISKTPLQKLFDRRPDLKCLQLTCPNTNTILPYVDLVNEVMESYVAFQTTLPFNVNDDETSAELLAQPQHIEYKAYERLQGTVYPFTLPYHQPIDAARIYLNFLGTSRHELLHNFRSARDKQHVLEPLTGINNSTQLPTLTPALTSRLDALNDEYLDKAADAEYLGLTQEEYVILTKEAFVSKEHWDIQSANPPTPNDYLARIGSKAVHEYYGYASEPEMLSIDETQQRGLTFVKDQFLKRTGLQYLELVELLKTQTLNPNVPKEQALSIMDRIQLSYRFLQTRVNNTPGISVEEKYRFVTEALIFITNPQSVAVLNRALGIDDPCAAATAGVAPDPSHVKERVHESFERVGKIIVLDNGAKCIDGKIFLRRDNLIDSGIRIENCQIIGPNGAVIGSVDKSTGLITMREAQPAGDLSIIVFVGNKGEQGTFLNVQGQLFLLTTQSETCDLEPVRLIHLDGTPLTVPEYDRIHRFIRLWRKSGWTINDVDSAFVGLGAAANFDLSPGLLHQLVAVKKVHEQTGLELTKLLTFWSGIGTVGPAALYKRLFLTRNLSGSRYGFSCGCKWAFPR